MRLISVVNFSDRVSITRRLSTVALGTTLATIERDGKLSVERVRSVTRKVYEDGSAITCVQL